ncbi:MAG TPA: ADP-ribosylglycohydrolase family protein [Polyangiaceae bacterium]|nr:ADP-ribosylglycohydrolase family protein [Polyangiaceae bacterium]
MFAREDRLAGVLLGTAVGDALGLPMEGMSAAAIARRYRRIDGYSLLGRRGFVSDDTEQSALVAACLSRHPDSLERCVRAFRRSLLGWFLRLPWGIGWGTLRACLRIALGFRHSGVSSAGNGAAMRASIVGAFFQEDATSRRAFSDALAQVTHTDARAIQGARFAAELTALSCRASAAVERQQLVTQALEVVDDAELGTALKLAAKLAVSDSSVEAAVQQLGCSGYVVHSAALATFCFLRFGDAPERALVATIRAGGDTDSNAAIIGAWLGALHGAKGLPHALVRSLHDGPFGPSHLRDLASDLASAPSPETPPRAAFFWPAALFLNLALYPVVLAHAVRVLAAR